jgi:hypothetical protein
VSIVVTGAAQISQILTVTSTFTANAASNLNGKTVVNSQADNLPFQVSGVGGQFWFYSKWWAK